MSLYSRLFMIEHVFENCLAQNVLKYTTIDNKWLVDNSLMIVMLALL